jgi:hypothetical protein
MSRAFSRLSGPREPGDKPILYGGSLSERSSFIDEILHLFQLKGSTSGYLLLKDLSEHFHSCPALAPCNLYRKQYGNFRQIFLLEDFTKIFDLSNDCLRLQAENIMETSDLSVEQLTKAKKLKESQLIHQLNTMKNIGENICVRCKTNFRCSAAQVKACKAHSKQQVCGVYQCCGRGALQPCTQAKHVSTYNWENFQQKLTKIDQGKIDYGQADMMVQAENEQKTEEQEEENTE